MEPTTIVGIIITIIVMFFGFRMLMRGSSQSVPSLDSELNVHEGSQQPVLPRHVRDQVKAEPTDKAQAAVPEDVAVAEEVPAVVAEEPQEKSVFATPPAPVKSEQAKKAELSLNTQLEKAQVPEFEDESSILDEHLHQQDCIDEESALANAEDLITLNVYADRRILSGDKTLKLLMKYGLRYGEMSCFHRYNEQGNKLLFSVLQLTDNGPVGFDLETLSTEQVKGLAFFLALPHVDVQNAFDTMESIARLIAREFDGTVYDANNQEFTPQMREHWRHYAIDFRSGRNSATH